MDKALEVLKMIDKEELEKMGGYKSIKLKYNEWVEIKDLVKENKHECLFESTKDEGNKKLYYTQNSSYDVIKSYKEWLNIDDNLSKSQCNCPELFGLYSW